MNDPLWPAYNSPDDLRRIEAVPLVERGLPATTYDVVRRTGQTWPDRVAVSVMPDATRWREVRSRTFGQLLHVTEPAAAPRAVIVVDALPLTPVGKPYKPALRADATRRAVAAALADLEGVRSVGSQVEGGAVVTTVTIDSSQVEEGVAQALGGYAVTWQVVLESAAAVSS